jgi:endoglucanase
MDSDKRRMYERLIKYAVTAFSALPRTAVYIDAGNSAWRDSDEALVAALRVAGIDQADGFSLNVSNFRTNEESISYGQMLADKLGGKHFIIDSSRNGLGPSKAPAVSDQNWCNPPGRALGHYPTTNTGIERLDAYVYIKVPGESDGTCADGPKAGEWWPEYALGLVERWPKELQPAR